MIVCLSGSPITLQNSVIFYVSSFLEKGLLSRSYIPTSIFKSCANRYHRIDEQIEFPAVVAVIRLSHKYKVHHVRDAYLSRMKACFPTDFDTWDAVNRNHGSLAMKFSDQHALAAVATARLTGTESMLPSALYLCCKLHPESILRGTPRWHDGPHEQLRTDDLVRCIQGRQFVLQQAIANILELFDAERRSPLCTHRRCLDTLALMRAQHAEGFAPRLVCDALQTREPHVRALQRAQYLCRSCADAVCEADVELCRQLWAKLPELMGVDPPDDWPKA